MIALSDRLSRFATPVVRWVALLGLCAAYLQGGLVKLADIHGAVGEMNHFGVSPAMPFAIAVIALELVASVAILTGYWRWLGALALSAFTIAASFMANAYWELGSPERFVSAISCFCAATSISRSAIWRGALSQRSSVLFILRSTKPSSSPMQLHIVRFSAREAASLRYFFSSGSTRSVLHRRLSFAFS